MDTTIRGLDERLYRSLKAQAALGGKTMGEAVSDAIRVYLARPEAHAVVLQRSASEACQC